MTAAIPDSPSRIVNQSYRTLSVCPGVDYENYWCESCAYCACNVLSFDCLAGPGERQVDTVDDQEPEVVSNASEDDTRELALKIEQFHQREA